jgi:predicted PurR-regulated permease PerM
MIELLCYIFLVAFLVFYSLLFLVLLGQGFRRALRRRIKRPRRVKATEHLPVMSLSPQTRPN